MPQIVKKYGASHQSQALFDSVNTWWVTNINVFLFGRLPPNLLCPRCLVIENVFYSAERSERE